MKPTCLSRFLDYRAPSLLVAMAYCLIGGYCLAVEPCRIDLVDEENGWPVPLVELQTTHHVRFVSDNAGVIAFDLPELMNRETWFTVEGHGYSVPKDGFGMAGVRLTPRPGATLTVKVQRQLPAKRLGRITGGGLFGESQKLGLKLDWPEQGILGCDSVQVAQHNGQLFWGWGDTVIPAYPLGLFHMSGATTPLRPLTKFEPPVDLHYDYFTDAKGRPRNVAQMPGDGPTWLGGYVSLADRTGKRRLVATYAKIKPPLETYEQGLCVWNDDADQFERLRVLWSQSADGGQPPSVPGGHAVRWTDDAGREFVLFGDPFPTLRSLATFEAWSNPDSWQALKPQTVVLSRRTKEKITPHRGSIAWNRHRGKWITVFCQIHGQPSMLGELWYAEADAPTGPWKDAVKVVTHANYSFYNPLVHPELTAADASFLIFEATYTKTFSGTECATPRHDYNQILYRLDFDEMGG